MRTRSCPLVDAIVDTFRIFSTMLFELYLIFCVPSVKRNTRVVLISDSIGTQPFHSVYLPLERCLPEYFRTKNQLKRIYVQVVLSFESRANELAVACSSCMFLDYGRRSTHPP